MQNFSISFFINNINASQETKHHQQQSKSVDEKKLKLEKTKTMKGLDLKHKNAEYLIISCQSQKKKKKKTSDYSSEKLGLAANYNNVPWRVEGYQETKDG
jgi:hypothetical protein